ncbi:MAG: hypothetical protein C4334_14255 [Pyrinomonas sp.]|uniref:TrmH family RNA methyltransferase n=1 Tax=Pyrinomonas sp. TaxID=2080306 RepID=UPI00333146A7
MRIVRLTSRSNETVKRARAVRDGRERGSIFIEGVRLCEEAIRSGLDIEELLIADSLSDDPKVKLIAEALGSKAQRLCLLSDELLASVSNTKTPQGIILLARRPATDRASFEHRLVARAETPFLIILHKINNPSNAGAILRTSEAAGATGVIATSGTTDLFSAKALRGAMGSAFRLPIWTGMMLPEAIEWCAKRQIRTFATHLGAEKSYTEINWRTPFAVVFGAEASGLKSDEVCIADETVKIPMHPPVESLNVAVAAGIILYEAVRQRSGTLCARDHEA